MQVQLKQTEIIAALKQYISGQGISLQGKQVEMAFTAGRKEAGISVEISIDEVGMPDFFKDSPEDPVKADAPALTLVKDTAAAAEAGDETPALLGAEGTAPAFFDDAVVQADPVALTPTGKSLFN